MSRLLRLYFHARLPACLPVCWDATVQESLALCLLFSGGTFLYVATVHILPEIQQQPSHHGTGDRKGRPRRQHRHSHRHDHGGHEQRGDCDHTPTAVVAIELSPQATAASMGAVASGANPADLPGSPAPRRHTHHHHQHPHHDRHADGAGSDDGHDAVAVQPLVVPTPGSPASGPLSPRLAMRPAAAGPGAGGSGAAVDALDATAGPADAAAARRRGGGAAPSGALRSASDGSDDHGHGAHDDDDDDDHSHAHEHARLSWPEVGTLVAGVLLPLLINLNHGH